MGKISSEKSSKKSLILIPLIVMILIFFSSIASAALSDFSAYSSNAEIRINSCSVFTDTIKFRNNGNEIVTFKLGLSGSASGFSVLTPGDFFLLPGESKEVYSFISPGCENAGKYSLKVIIDTNFGTKELSQEIIVTKPSNLELSVAESSIESCSNESAVFEFTLRNTGTFKEHYTFGTRGLFGKSSLDRKEAWLMPNETAKIALNFTIGKAGKYESTFIAKSENSGLSSEIPLKITLNKCGVQKSIITRIGEMLKGIAKLLKIIIIALLILIAVIILLVLLIRKFIPFLRNKLAERKMKKAEEKAQEPYYKPIVGKKEKNVLKAKSVAKAEKTLKPKAAKPKVSEKPIKEKPAEKMRIDWLKWIVVFLWIALIVFAILYFVGFSNVKAGISDAAESVKNFFAEIFKSLKLFFANVFAKAVKSPEKEAISQNLSGKNASGGIIVPAENATAPKPVESSNKSGGIKPMLTINNTGAGNATESATPNASTAPKQNGTAAKESPIPSPVQKESPAANKTQLPKTNSKAKDFITSAWEYVKLYLNYIVLGVALTIVFIIFMNVSENRAKKK
ncbi:MAG: hypothetical protein NTV63_04110 [Candidatus Woesearchaeota archaeon]|nr:hypothetical protein [Candidatus Woesearchaeota archaeon]